MLLASPQTATSKANPALSPFFKGGRQAAPSRAGRPSRRRTHERPARQPQPAARSRHRLHRRTGTGRAQGLDDHPCRRQGRHPDPALLLPRQAGDRRQLPHVPGRSGEDAQARAGLRHAGHGRHEGRHAQRQGAEVAAQRDGDAADQPSARLPDLRPGRRVRAAGRVDGLRPLGQPVRRAQARGRRRGPGPAGRHRHDPLHPVHALRALHRGSRGDLRARRHAARREPGHRHIRRQAIGHRAVGQRDRRMPGRRIDQQGVPFQGASLGTDREGVARLPRCARQQPVPARAPRRSAAFGAARQRGGQRMLAVGPRSLLAPGPVRGRSRDQAPDPRG